MQIPVELKFVGSHNVKPCYATAGSAAVDLFADVSKPVTIFPGERAKIQTGLAVHIKDPSVAGIIVGRSGFGFSHGISVAQGFGLIDSDYTGELIVSLVNNDAEEYFTILPGMKIAQFLLVSVIQARFNVVEELPETGRGANGFGSTGQMVEV